jgi:hypothetical protein
MGNGAHTHRKARRERKKEERKTRGALFLVAALVALSAAAYAGLPIVVWTDGFEQGLGNWTLANPSGDATTMASALQSYSSTQGTIVPCEGSWMAQIYKENGGLAYLTSVPISAVAGQSYEIDVCVGGLGEFDNCGFRWNKWGYSPDGSSITWVGDNFRNVNPLQCGVGYSFVATGNVINVVLGLDRACRDGLGHSAFFDNVVVSTSTTVVPEPASLLLALAGGVTGLAVRLRRRR